MNNIFIMFSPRQLHIMQERHALSVGMLLMLSKEAFFILLFFLYSFIPSCLSSGAGWTGRGAHTDLTLTTSKQCMNRFCLLDPQKCFFLCRRPLHFLKHIFSVLVLLVEKHIDEKRRKCGTVRQRVDASVP